MKYDIAFIFIQEPLFQISAPELVSWFCVFLSFKINLSKGESSSVLSAMD